MLFEKKIGRRQTIRILAAVSAGGATGWALADGHGKGVGAMIPGEGWVNATAQKSEHDGTPLQFMPKTAPEDNPQENDIQKYPRCPYCGMKRKMWHHSRHLVHYDDGLADGTCSIHCAAISLSLNLDRGPRAIYAADYGSNAEAKSLVEVGGATYLVGSRLKGTMSANSKMAFASVAAAEAAQNDQGGEIMDFDGALEQAYLDMAKDTTMIRKRRAEKVRKMMEKKQRTGG